MKGEIFISRKSEDGAALYLLTVLMLMILIIITIGNGIPRSEERVILQNKKISSYVRTESIILEEREIGYLIPFASKKEVLQELTSMYIKELDINEENIMWVNIEGDIRTEHKMIDSTVNKMLTPSDIAKIIHEICKKEDSVLKVNIRVENEEDKKIEPITTVVNTKSLYMGESSEKKGKYGIKRIKKEVIYSNSKKETETVFSQSVIQKPENKIIYKGTKNPIEDKIAFLSHPTGGGVLTSAFGSRWGDFHKGIDIGEDIGTPVTVASDGVVVEAGYNNGGYGNLIIVEHENRIDTYYAHLDKISVKVGQKVKKGDKIGEVGNTGYSTGPHLHFELRVDNEPVNPIEYIQE